jgi:hypothetical protein
MTRDYDVYPDQETFRPTTKSRSDMSERCGVRGEAHPTMPHMVEECARDEGHAGDHCSVLHKSAAEAEAHHRRADLRAAVVAVPADTTR